MKVRFTVYLKREGTEHYYDPVYIVKEAPTFEEALEQLTKDYPRHHVAKHLEGLYEIEES